MHPRLSDNAALVQSCGAKLVVPAFVGLGVWGVNVPFVWGFDLINYAWWIGVANGVRGGRGIQRAQECDLRTEQLSLRRPRFRFAPA